MFPIQNLRVECEVCLSVTPGFLGDKEPIFRKRYCVCFFCMFLCEIVDRFDFHRSWGRSAGSFPEQWLVIEPRLLPAVCGYFSCSRGGVCSLRNFG